MAQFFMGPSLLSAAVAFNDTPSLRAPAARRGRLSGRRGGADLHARNSYLDRSDLQLLSFRTAAVGPLRTKSRVKKALPNSLYYRQEVA